MQSPPELLLSVLCSVCDSSALLSTRVWNLLSVDGDLTDELLFGWTLVMLECDIILVTVAMVTGKEYGLDTVFLSP